MRDFPCACDLKTFGHCVCKELVNIQFGKPVTFLDRINAASMIFSPEKVVDSFSEIDYSHAFCDFLDKKTQKQIVEHMYLKSLSESGFTYCLVGFSGRFFAHIVSKNNFCVGCLTPKEVLKIYRKLVFSKGGGLSRPLIIYREQL